MAMGFYIVMNFLIMKPAIASYSDADAKTTLPYRNIDSRTSA
jgi:hypothetical protein